MTVSHGFELLKEDFIEELNTNACRWRHRKTGAELLSLENNDENKVFGITFRTPPPDSTGLPHIMEHSVLGGSRKYQVREPFVELVKGSMKTFLNAFTGADRTMYPVASTNLQDFYNLIDVYLDAVFYPLITPQHLAQEGWHYELDDADDPLTYKGVVFNEMKGAYSSPDSVLYRFSKQTLFPGHPYGEDSGGDPAEMVGLTYEQFKDFHETYYHPSNARVFFYGDDEPEERLRLMNAWLDDFEAIEVESAVSAVAPFTAPKRFEYPYAVDGEAEVGNKHYIQLNWALPDTADPELTMALSVLSQALVGNSAAPLHKALIDSGLGEDVTGGGLSGSLRQMTFSVGLKGVDDNNLGDVEQLILKTLRQLAGEGIEKETVESAVNTIEFNLRENNTGSYPRGLLLMMRTLNTWLYDRDPLLLLKYEAPLAAIKERLASDQGYLQALIREYLLDNTHRSTVILGPDPQLQQREEAAEREKLAEIKAAMDETDLQAAIENTRQLRLLQQTPDDPAELAKIPRLGLDDLEKENTPIPLEIERAHGAELLYHDLFTNGIVYLDVGFSFHTLPADLLPYVKLYGRSLTQIGTETEDFVKLSQRIGRTTGGVGASVYSSGQQGSDEAATWLFLRGKATMDHTRDMLDIMRDVLLTVDFDNQERFRQMVLENKARKESSLIPSGHSVVNARLRAHFSEEGWIGEQMGGVSYLFFLRQLAQEAEGDWPGVLEKLQRIHELVVNCDGAVVNVTVDADNYAQFRPELDEFLATLPAADAKLATWQRDGLPVNEGLTIPAQVNYVGKGTSLYQHGYELDGSLSVISNYLRTSFLWEKIRAQGGAYGALMSFDRYSGVLNLLSYRDPNLVGTLANYDAAVQFLHQLELSEDELVKSIIGAISSMDAYQLPDAKGRSSMKRYLTGYTDEARQQYREEMLTTTADDFKAFAEVLAQVRDHGHVAVLGSADAISAANDELARTLHVTKVM